MNDFIHKIFISLLTSCSILYLAVNSQAQSNCHTSVVGNLTNGVTADLIIGADGVSLLGIRVMWSIKPEYLGCQFTTLRVELNNGELGRDISVTDRSADFLSYRFDCNRQYSPRVRAVLSGIVKNNRGISVFYRGAMAAPPSQLLRVCVGRPTSLAYRGRVNISWDPLPCHLQNGADIIGYIIQYTRLSTGEATNISSSSTRLICRQESGGPYSCLAPASFFIQRMTYSFQVAARNIYGNGSFSDPVNSTIITGSQDTTCTEIGNFGTATTAAVTVLEDTNSTSIIVSTTTNTAKMTIVKHCTCQEAWTLMGSLVAIIAVLAGMVITSLLIVNYIPWKRLSRVKNSKQALHDKSGDIDMKECSVYGKVISPQAVTGQQHIYESTT